MKYQIIGLTKDTEYERCIEALERLNVPFTRQLSRIAPFDTREHAELALRACRAAAPEAPLGIEDVPDLPAE
jgi:hypothetical protein